MPRGTQHLKSFFLTLRQLPGQVWVAFLLHMLDSFAYFAISTNLTIYLTTNFGVDDVTAGVYYGVWGALLVVFGIPTGFLIDRLGIKTSLIVGAVFNSLGRTIFALSDSLPIALTALFFGTTIGSGFFISVLHVAVNRYTETEKSHSSVAFALLYTFMNVGAIGAMLGTDLALEVTLFFEGYRLLFVTGAAASIISLAIAVLYKDKDKGTANLMDEGPLTLRQCAGVFCEREFWRLITINVFCIGVRSMFRHWETLLPKWLTRVYPGVHYGTVLALNPILIIPSTPIVGTLTQHIKHVYWILVFGTLLSALSPLPPWLWITPSLTPVILSICIFTILGEASYSPKLGQITLERSPPGKKGIYSGLIPIPYFAGNIFSGLFSGWLLDSYCPEIEGSSEEFSSGLSNSTSDFEYDPMRAYQCSKVWGWIILTAITSPILLAAFYKLLNPRETITEQYHRFRESELEEFDE
jgi:MFS family permease